MPPCYSSHVNSINRKQILTYFYTNYKICPATCHSTILITEVALNMYIQTDSNSQAVNLIFLSTSELTKQGCAVNINDVGLFWVPGHVFASNFIAFI